MNTLDLTVLRALARLSRMRKVVDCEALALRAGGSLEDVRGALGRLSRAELVDRRAGARLTMAGLAVAVASAGAVQHRQARLARRRAA
jgi:RIO-like serine/threonine protein kinase